jgi:hypothetical protein
MVQRSLNSALSIAEIKVLILLLKLITCHYFLRIIIFKQKKITEPKKLISFVRILLNIKIILIIIITYFLTR